MLSFSKKDLQNDLDNTVLRSLIKSYFDLGGFHLHMNVVSVDTLEDAKRHPENYSDLLVRISGFSAKFVTLDTELQNAIIERTRNGA